MLLMPFGRTLAQGLDANAARQTSIDRRLDQTRCKECERDHAVDLANAAFFPICDLLDTYGSDDDFIQSMPAFCNGGESRDADGRLKEGQPVCVACSFTVHGLLYERRHPRPILNMGQSASAAARVQPRNGCGCQQEHGSSVPCFELAKRIAPLLRTGEMS
jgi:hypothetical protein